MNTYTVTIQWRKNETLPPEYIQDITSKGRDIVTSATITLNAGCDLSPETICDVVFHDTNLQSGAVWHKLQPVLPERRTHTSLSVGDHVIVDGLTFRCREIGWELVSASCTRCEEALVGHWNLAPIGVNEDNTERIYEDGVRLCDECYDHWCTKYDTQPLKGE